MLVHLSILRFLYDVPQATILVNVDKRVVGLITHPADVLTSLVEIRAVEIPL